MNFNFGNRNEGETVYDGILGKSSGQKSKVQCNTRGVTSEADGYKRWSKVLHKPSSSSCGRQWCRNRVEVIRKEPGACPFHGRSVDIRAADYDFSTANSLSG